MCGINGIIGTESGLEQTIEAMNDVLRNRGPDGDGTFVDKGVALGHRRLAIVDAANDAANQPMISGRYVITFNGEIYNHKVLREELEYHGVSFRTECDTEVLLEGYRIFGEDILKKLNGQFAFAIYDKDSGSTFLARDRTAMKPLYFSLENGLRFSSSPRAISASIGFEPSLDGVASLLLNGATFAAGEEPLGGSTYSGISSLRPGESMVVSSDGNVELKTYYSLPIHDLDTPDSELESVQRLRETLENAIKMRIPDEVKVGCALSGGLDSSIITAVTADSYKGEVVASCIRYTADTHNDDYEHAKILAASRENVRLVSADISPENFLNDLEEMVSVLGIHDSIRQLAMFRNYRVLQEEGAKVVLTGEGADEFNWGYWHKFPGLKTDQEACSSEERFRELVLARKNYVQQLFSPGIVDQVNFDGAVEYLLEIYSSFDTTDSTRRMMGVYAVDFLGFLNKANDQCALASSIEARCPFQDVEVVETCLEIPQEYQIKEGTEKHLLREAFRDVLPEEIYSRGKSPLPAAAHLDYHKKIAQEFATRMEIVDDTFWDYFNRDTFEKISENYNRRIGELETTYSPEEAGAKLMEWRPISGTCDIVKGDDIRTNDVFKLLTTIVWYDQNRRER